MTEAEVFKKAISIVCDKQDPYRSFDALNAVAALASKRSFSDPPDNENSNCGVIGLWFDDGSFAGVVVSDRGVFIATHETVPGTLKETEKLNSKLRLFLSDELLKQAA